MGAHVAYRHAPTGCRALHPCIPCVQSPFGKCPVAKPSYYHYSPAGNGNCSCSWQLAEAQPGPQCMHLHVKSGGASQAEASVHVGGEETTALVEITSNDAAQCGEDKRSLETPCPRGAISHRPRPSAAKGTLLTLNLDIKRPVGQHAALHTQASPASCRGRQKKDCFTPGIWSRRPHFRNQRTTTNACPASMPCGVLAGRASCARVRGCRRPASCEEPIAPWSDARRQCKNLAKSEQSSRATTRPQPAVSCHQEAVRTSPLSPA